MSILVDHARAALRAIGLATFIALLLLSTWFLLRPSPSAFSVEAETESITFFPADAELAMWRLFDVAVPSSSGQSPRDVRAEAELSIACGTRVSLERVGHGPIRIGLTEPLDGNSVGIIEFASGEPTRIDLGQEAVLIMRAGGKDNPTPVLPFRGRVFLGSDARAGRIALLHSGRLTVLGKSILGDTRYVANEITLLPGDYVAFPFDSTDACKQGPSIVRAPQGFLRTASDQGEGGLQVVLYAPAAGASVNRLGRSEEVVWASPWAPFAYDPAFSRLIGFFGFVAVALGILEWRKS